MATTKTSSIRYHVPPGLRFRRWFLRTLFRGIFRVLCRVQFEGKGNIPANGAYLIAHNHVSIIEPPFILTFWPVPPEAIGGDDVFSRPGQGFMVKAYGTIPVRRGRYDRQVIETMLALLSAGRPLLIAPEGTRSHKPGLQRARPGVAFLMDRAGVPVVPVGIVGSTEDLVKRALRAQQPRLEMRIGQPFVLPTISGQGKTRRKARQRNADLVMRRIAELLPEDYRGVYADDS